MAKIKLFNKGKRTIHCGTAEAPREFAPGKVLSFDEEETAKLLALFPGEVHDLESITDEFKAADEASEEETAPAGADGFEADITTGTKKPGKKA